uniref:Uncharacterized protein n=1 Tax=Peronospora matthiolae TaxID=2874970 RepID=A0AAV1V568_9STRA
MQDGAAGASNLVDSPSPICRLWVSLAIAHSLLATAGGTEWEGRPYTTVRELKLKHGQLLPWSQELPSQPREK